jgi:membrane protein YdbS with pleckstrin-like domain
VSEKDKTKEDRAFQYELTKLQVLSEYLIALLVSMLAIAYGLLSFYREDVSMSLGIGAIISIVLVLLAVTAIAIVRKLSQIRQKYIES